MLKKWIAGHQLAVASGAKKAGKNSSSSLPFCGKSDRIFFTALVEVICTAGDSLRPTLTDIQAANEKVCYSIL